MKSNSSTHPFPHGLSANTLVFKEEYYVRSKESEYRLRFPAVLRSSLGSFYRCGHSNRGRSWALMEWGMKLRPESLRFSSASHLLSQEVLVSHACSVRGSDDASPAQPQVESDVEQRHDYRTMFQMLWNILVLPIKLLGRDACTVLLLYLKSVFTLMHPLRKLHKRKVLTSALIDILSARRIHWFQNPMEGSEEKGEMFVHSFVDCNPLYCLHRLEETCLSATRMWMWKLLRRTASGLDAMHTRDRQSNTTWPPSRFCFNPRL